MATKKSAKKSAPKKIAATTKSPALKKSVATKKPVTAKKSATAKNAVAAKKSAIAKKPVAAKASVRAGRTTTTRVVVKKSPLAGMDLVDYARGLPMNQAEMVLRIAKLVERTAPSSRAIIKWGQPVFESNGPFAFIKPASAHVTFGFWRGTELTDPDGILLGDGDRMRHIKFSALADINEARVESFVKLAVALNKKKGDPTLRG